jgi:hypothetical protein
MYAYIKNNSIAFISATKIPIHSEMIELEY